MLNVGRRSVARLRERRRSVGRSLLNESRCRLYKVETLRIDGHRRGWGCIYIKCTNWLALDGDEQRIVWQVVGCQCILTDWASWKVVARGQRRDTLRKDRLCGGSNCSL